MPRYRVELKEKREREREKEGEGETDRQRNSGIDRQLDRQIGRQSDIEIISKLFNIHYTTVYKQKFTQFQVSYVIEMYLLLT